MKYMADELSLQNPILESRLLSSHVDFANTSTQNNVYVYVVPRLEAKTSIPKQSNFLSFAQKENIKNGLEQAKSLGLEPVFVDPVYMAVDLFSKNPNRTLSVENVGSSKLYLVKNQDVPRDSENIKAEAIEILKTYFKHTNIVLGQSIKISEIQNALLSITGVQNIYTSDGSTKTNGLGLAVWNPVYTQDINFYSQDVKLQYFKFPYLNDIDQIASRIVIES